MRLQGLESLRRHIPEGHTAWGLLRGPLGVAAVFILTSLFFIAADRGFSEWMPDGEIVILALGFLILSRFFSQRKRLLEQYHEQAFWQAFKRYNIPGLGIVAASVGHLGYMAGPALPNIWWRPWLIALGWLLLAFGIALWLRAMLDLGIDRGVMLYVYYPSEDTEPASGIYAILRHPIYSATMHIGMGLALIHANWYSLLVALLLPLFFMGWIRLVEERELIERFPGYKDYRRQVPALFPKPARVGKLLWYLASGR